MNKFTTSYYLLFVLLIMGAFASMAQNDYGITILGLVASLFCLLFAFQFILFVIKGGHKKNVDGVIEMTSLILLSGILAMRVFYIRFPYVEELFIVSGFMLIGAYIMKLFVTYKNTREESNLMARMMLLYHGSIILYVASMISVAVVPRLSEPTGGFAFALIILFIVLSLLRRKILVGGEKISSIQFVQRFKDRSLVLIILFLVFTAYLGLTKINVLPKMYSDEFPQAYFELVKQAETVIDKPVEGKYKHEEFKKAYDLFVEKNIQ